MSKSSDPVEHGMGRFKILHSEVKFCQASESDVAAPPILHARPYRSA